uniref:limulus clotting factor C n=1 Tax=Amaurobius ferox TaxID=336583 RepID=A0A2I5YNX3_9ARAC|nr:putative PQM protease precursor [Amaurobius ferox]
MRFIKATFLLFLAGYTSAELRTVANCGKKLLPKGRIVGGKTAGHGDYPWMVSMQEKNKKGTFDHVCGGSIINENWIVTAAHCFDQPLDVKNYKAYVGLHSILKTNEPTVQKHEIAQVFIHEDYKADGNANDIALVKTVLAININGSNGYVNGICLPKGVTNPSGNATVIGWGRLYSGGPMPDKLQQVTVPIVAWADCKAIYENVNSEYDYLVTPATLCAGGKGKDSCENDSGGPLFQTDKNGVSTLIGTVANGAECAYKHYPGMYMKVSAFTGWMGRKM